ncbi:MAG: putative Fe-S protein [Rhodobacteraceae bacterium HLUCCA12]|nr:MAG: putative Fe-S protein [Rhodobacteraceae bacterium HLUCCA12]
MNDQSQNRIWQRAEIESPCVNICMVHPRAGICTGCYRTLDEIGSWSQMSPEARKAVLAELPGRAASLKKRRGGRAGRLTDPE